MKNGTFGGCLEELPTVIFRLIQSYCVFKRDYRRLMNANRSTFETVKFETVYLTLKISHELNTQEEDALRRLINHVMDKSKQISMSFDKVSQGTISKLTSFWDGIDKITLKPARLARYDDFSFQAFTNIIELKLENIHDIPKANLYLEKTSKLNISDCGFVEITAWNSQSSLHEVMIYACDSLVKVPSLENIRHLLLFSAVSAVTCRPAKEIRLPWKSFLTIITIHVKSSIVFG
jgi:hypothetical protein